MQKVQWTASLSNGETVYEGKGNFQVIEGALSPWQRLLHYMADNGLEITSLSLYTDSGFRWNLPSAGKNPRFYKVIGDAPIPIDYRVFTAETSEQDMSTSNNDMNNIG